MKEENKIKNLKVNEVLEHTSIQKEPILEGELTGYPSIDKPWLKYYSQEALKDETPKMSVYDYLKRQIQKHPDNIAINYYGKKITYKEFLDRVDNLANSFITNNISNGDVVSLCMPALPETMISYFALNKIGAVANIIDPRIIKEQIEEFINCTNSKMLITIDKIIPKIECIKDNLCVDKIVTVSPNNSLPSIKKMLINFKEKINGNDVDTSKYMNFNELEQIGRLIIHIPDNTYEKDKPAEIVYTTGTTGKPKGAIITNDNTLAMVKEQLYALPEYMPGDVFLCIMPPFIAYGSLWGMIIPLMAGMQVQIIPQFKIEDFPELILEYKPKAIMGVPSFYEALISSNKFIGKDLSFLKYPICGGNGMTPTSEIRVNKFFEEHSCPSKMLKGYGMTEVASAIAFPIKDEVNEIGSVGIPLIKAKVKVMDLNTCNELKYNTKGELWLGGETVIKGYVNNPEQESQTFITDDNGERWVKSGDIGYMTENGIIYITGRSKRSIIKQDGHNVYPGEIENVLTSHPSVLDCCCVGAPLPNLENGVVPTAYVVLKDEYKGYEKEIEKKLREYSNKFLPPREVADEYVFVDKIPLLDGKVDYRQVESWAKKRVKKQTQLGQKTLKKQKKG
ncbi:MAG: class I adenylate-forming enzyme family protein [bacterium]|nr:class I adenylate-forming enzyme family protein [bacterium]